MSALEANGIYVLLLILAALALAGVIISAAADQRYKSSDFRPRCWAAGRGRPDVRDVGHQIHAVMSATFQKRKLLNGAEYRLFRLVEAEVTAAGRGHRAFAQTNLGEILTSSSRDGFASINSKRVDILIVDGAGWPVAAVEYQGPGHYQGTAAARDAVKKEALRKAGVRYLEVCAGDRPEQVRTRLREEMGWGVAAPTSSKPAEDAPPRPHFGTAGLSPGLSNAR
jgi:hypothetical protein